jgi:hypothetical protein
MHRNVVFLVPNLFFLVLGIECLGRSLYKDHSSEWRWICKVYYQYQANGQIRGWLGWACLSHRCWRRHACWVWILFCLFHDLFDWFSIFYIFHYCRSVDRQKYQIQIPLPPKIDASVTMMQVSPQLLFVFIIHACRLKKSRMWRTVTWVVVKNKLKNFVKLSKFRFCRYTNISKISQLHYYILYYRGKCFLFYTNNHFIYM